MACCPARAMPAASASGGRLVDEHAGHAVDDRFERAASRERDDGRAAGLRLDRRDAEVFFAWKQHGGRAAIVIAHVLVGQRSEQLHVGAGARDERGQSVALRPVADDAKRRAREAARLDRHVYAFVWNER